MFSQRLLVGKHSQRTHGEVLLGLLAWLLGCVKLRTSFLSLRVEGQDDDSG